MFGFMKRLKELERKHEEILDISCRLVSQGIRTLRYADVVACEMCGCLMFKPGEGSFICDGCADEEVEREFEECSAAPAPSHKYPGDVSSRCWEVNHGGIYTVIEADCAATSGGQLAFYTDDKLVAAFDKWDMFMEMASDTPCEKRCSCNG